ncbi:hypothetical protein Q6D67_09010 [Haliea sp. E1-2-M8]|uniref:hypothetical protein n=1 Tax=Haliea sp. E1-2-M8 TaxID=3064706 RepID=UPI002716537E|nr:hypothetical protein [Haliea sp. E1-2-M8]MDO8861840.1 hypothetical protein [Haliea sp. E1-2-M8]
MKCYICGLEEGTNLLEEPVGGDKELVHCRRCGDYEISGTAKAQLAHTGQHLDLSAYLRDWNIVGGRPAILDSNSLAKICQNLPKYSVSEKQSYLLASLAAISKYPGDHIRLEPEVDMVLAWAKSSQEFGYYVDALIGRGLLTPIGSKTYDGTPPIVFLSPAGWEAFEKNSTVPEKSAQVFVAMSFSGLMLPVFAEAIKPAIESIGYRPYRVDHDLHLDRIDAKIIAEIRKSRFIVADVTEQKAGVYFEAGYAHGLDIPVIWSVRSDELDRVHFDTRQFYHIVWENPADLSEKLRNFIDGFFGYGPKYKTRDGA